MLETGYWILDSGYWILDTGYWILDIGYWILDIGYWMPEARDERVAAGEAANPFGLAVPLFNAKVTMRGSRNLL